MEIWTQVSIHLKALTFHIWLPLTLFFCFIIHLIVMSISEATCVKKKGQTELRGNKQ